MACRILIIYEKMGMGHLRMARILEEILNREDVEITTVAGSDLLGTSDVNTAVRLWNFFINRNWIRAADIIINFAARLVALPLSEVMRTAAGIRKVEELKPDLIISTADLYNRGLGTYAAKRGLPFFIFITEISVFIDLVSPKATHLCYFKETCRAVRSYDFSRSYFSYNLDDNAPRRQKAAYVIRFFHDYILKGLVNPIFRNPGRPLPQLNEARCLAVGPLAEKRFFQTYDPDGLREKHGIPPGETVLAASGSLGGRFLLEVVQALELSFPRPLNLLVMCGSDSGAYRRLLERKGSHNRLNVLPFPFTPCFDELLEISDCVIIRPSAGIFIESLIKKTPVVTVGPATSNDQGALSIIEAYRVGRVCRVRGLAKAVEEVLDHRSYFRENIDKLLAGYPASWEEKRTMIRGLVLPAENMEGMTDAGGNR